MPIDGSSPSFRVRGQGRSDTDGPALKLGLAARPFAMKPSLNELRRLTGMPLRSDRMILSAALRLYRAGVKIVLVLMGRRAS